MRIRLVPIDQTQQGATLHIVVLVANRAKEFLHALLGIVRVHQATKMLRRHRKRVTRNRITSNPHRIQLPQHRDIVLHAITTQHMPFIDPSTADLDALQITPRAFEDYKNNVHTIDALIVADKLADTKYLNNWIEAWIAHPDRPINELPLVVENELTLKKDYYDTQVRNYVFDGDLDSLKRVWVSKAVPEDIFNAVCTHPFNKPMVKFLFKRKCKPTPKVFIQAVIQDNLYIVKKCLRRGLNINQPYEQYTPFEWAVRCAGVPAVDTCLLFGGEITSRAIMISIRRPEIFIRLCQEGVTLRPEHLYELVRYAFEEHQRNFSVPPIVHQMFQEMYIQQVPMGAYSRNIESIRHYVTHRPLRADLDIFCEA